MGVQAETHIVMLSNYCGFGTPLLKQNGVTISTGAAYIVNGPLSAIACGTNGEGCTILETTLDNAQGSSTTFNMTSYSVPTGFGYYNGCDGEGWDCCPGATGIISPLPIRCAAENVDLAVTFCD
ncbi:glycopeptide [Lentinula aff. detonsa]|nr:glycopeptide [Lentinula aff. detonsa]